MSAERTNPRLENYFERTGEMSYGQWNNEYAPNFVFGYRFMEDGFGISIDQYTPMGYSGSHGAEEQGLNPIVHLLPHTQTSTPHMQIRSAILGETQANGPRKVLTVPNNNFGAPGHLKAKFENGDFSPYGELVAIALEHYGIKKVDVVGYSLGASTGASVIERSLGEHSTFEVGHAWLGDPPNTVERTSKQLQKDFKGEGWSEIDTFLRTVAESEYQPYIDAIGSKGVFLIDLLEFAVGSQYPCNRALQKGMATDSFMGTMQRISDRHWSDLYVTLARAENSRITLVEPLNKIMTMRHNPTLFTETIKGGGHERGDQVRQIAGHVATALSVR